MKFSQVFKGLKAFCSKCIGLCRSDAGINIIETVFTVAFYGVCINIAAKTLFGFSSINILTIFSFGFLFYLIKEEIPSIIRRIIK